MTNLPKLKADDVCGVCSEIRVDHGDKLHKFSIDGTLEPITPGPPPRRNPPQERMSEPAKALSRDPVTGMSLRLIEVLVKKQILNGEDLMEIFGGDSSAATGGKNTE